MTKPALVHSGDPTVFCFFCLNDSNPPVLPTTLTYTVSAENES